MVLNIVRELITYVNNFSNENIESMPAVIMTYHESGHKDFKYKVIIYVPESDSKEEIFQKADEAAIKLIAKYKEHKKDYISISGEPEKKVIDNLTEAELIK